MADDSDFSPAELEATYSDVTATVVQSVLSRVSASRLISGLRADRCLKRSISLDLYREWVASEVAPSALILHAATPVFVVRAGGGGSMFPTFERLGVIGISFDDQIPGDVSAWSDDDFAHCGATSSTIGQVRRFAKSIPIGSMVIAPLQGGHQLAVGEVTSDYRWDDSPKLEGYPHVRSVRWHGPRSRDALPGKIQASLGSISTVFQPRGSPQLLALAAMREIPPLDDDEDTSAVVPALDALEAILGDVFPEQPADWEDAATLLRGEGDLAERAANLKAKAQTELRKRNRTGTQQRFFVTADGRVGLVAWAGEAVLRQAGAQRDRVATQLLDRLHELDPYQFELLIGVVLDAIGVEGVEVTKPSSDKGIDVKGRLVLHGLISRRVAVSVKRYKGNVGAPDVQNLRGSLDSHELGVVMSTADFTPAARFEASAPGKAPVSLIGGRQLAELMIDVGIGVQSTTTTVFTLAPLPTGAPATGQGQLD